MLHSGASEPALQPERKSDADNASAQLLETRTTCLPHQNDPNGDKDFSHPNNGDNKDGQGHQFVIKIEVHTDVSDQLSWCFGCRKGSGIRIGL